MASAHVLLLFFFFYNSVPLPVRTRPFGRRRSGLGVVGLGEPPEAGPGGPGARGAGRVYGRRPVSFLFFKFLSFGAWKVTEGS